MNVSNNLNINGNTTIHSSANWPKGSEPEIIEEGLYGATYEGKQGPLYLRMQLLTEKTSASWGQFKQMADFVANSRGRGILSTLLILAGQPNYPEYEKCAKNTGFSKEEYAAFTKKAIELKNANSKIVNVIAANSTGSQFMSTFVNGSNHIVYISKNPHFSICDSESIIAKGFTLKNFIDAYSDILICVGTDFSEKESFHSRGISRNPQWVFEGKYAGLSMLLHGFTGAVAWKYFPEKKYMLVMPLGSMQCIITKSLLPGEGHLKDWSREIDLTTLDSKPEDPEGKMNYIKITALKNIYDHSVRTYAQKKSSAPTDPWDLSCYHGHALFDNAPQTSLSN